MEEKLHISKVPRDSFLDIELDETQDWMKSLLDELSEDVDVEEREEVEGNPSIFFEGSLEKKEEANLGDVVVIEGNLQASFYTYCVSSGDPMMDFVDIDIFAVFIADELQQKMGYEDEVELVIDEEEYDLFYYEKSLCDLKGLFHEYLFLNKNPYPKKEEGEED